MAIFKTTAERPEIHRVRGALSGLYELIVSDYLIASIE